MLETLMKADGLTVETQTRLFEAFKASSEFDKLAQLCQLEFLDPAIDDKLSKIPNVAVRTSWLTRPGRKVEEITNMVAKEKRITVLTELATMDIDVDGFYEPLAESQNAKVLMALISNGKAPLELRSKASRTLATLHRNMSWTQQHQLDAMWTAQPELCGGALEVADGMTMVRKLLVATTASAKAKANVMKHLKQLAAEAEAEGKAGKYHWGVQSQVADLYHCTQMALTADWCDDKMTDQLIELVNHVAIGPAGKYAAASDVAEMQLVVAQVRGGENDPMAELMDRAANATDDTVDALHEQLRPLPDKRAFPVRLALLNNAGLAVTTQLKVIEEMTWHQRHDLYHQRFEANTEAALVLSANGGHRYQNVTDLVVENLGAVDERNAGHVVSNLFAANQLSDEQLMTIPCRYVNQAVLANPGGKSTARFGTLLAAELENESEMVWQQFRSMCKSFHGSTAQLLEVCRATAV